MQRTVFITIFQGAEAKNILRTDIYARLLREPDLRIVLLVKTPERGDYYKKEFSHPNVSYEVAPEFSPNRWDRFFSWFAFLTLRTGTVDLRRRMTLETDKNYFRFFSGWLLNRLLGWRLIRQMARWFDSRLSSGGSFGKLFDKYDPRTVFCAHLFDDAEVAILKEARRRGVASIGFINSWDKLTSRHTVRILPDWLVVFNELVKQEAMRHADMSESRIFVTGVPQYDQYIKEKPADRAGFFAKIGADPSKKLIVYAPMGKTFSNSDWDIVDLLTAWIKEGKITAQLLVRFQPNDFFNEVELKKRPSLIYDWPGIRFSKERGVDWDMSFADLKHLTDTLFHADLFVCYASSMSIDAAIFDKPVINIDFEVRPKEVMAKSPTYFYQMTHYQNAVRTGGIKYPKSKEEFLRNINDYLANPSADRSGRARLIREQCGAVDGRAGERIGEFIISKI